jgi:magnesium-transporting ATPase (P-type)
VLVQNQRTKRVYFHSKGSPEKMYDYLRHEDRDEARSRVESLARRGLRVLLYAYVELDWETVQEQFVKYVEHNC